MKKALKDYAIIIASFISIATLALALSGCATTLNPQGIYRGDKVMYQAELAIPATYNVVNSFLIFEENNRAALSGWPEVKKFADGIRKTYPSAEATAHVMLNAYKANPNPGNAENLTKALDVLRAALTGASAYMVQIGTVK